MNRVEDGLLVIDKEAGWTSHDVVAKLRRILSMKRVGHTGTLDPMATGVLPVLFGKATRLADLIQEGTKVYEAVMRLGVQTDTQDMTGQILAECDTLPPEEAVSAAARGFLGVQLQVPPMYSARKVHGKKLYELARQGQVIEREAREIRIDSLTIDRICMPYVSMTVTCSKGTYIRTLCHDLGIKLGCGGAMESLRRIRTGEYQIAGSHTLEEVERAVLEDRLSGIVLRVDDILAAWPAAVCLPSADRLLLNGNSVKEEHLVGKPEFADDSREKLVRMYTSTGDFPGLYRFDEEKGRYLPYKMLL